MKPIPAPTSSEEETPLISPASASDLLKASAPKASHGNRRSPHANAQQAYPWLLAASTAIAVLFGLLYITKPVLVDGPSAGMEDTTPKSLPPDSEAAENSLLPKGQHLPGEQATANTPTSQNPDNLISAPTQSQFEETNLRMQHILTATSEGGHVSRIDLEVPVLYQSRKLRWTPIEVARAQDLMIRLMEYQDQSRKLKTQGERLLMDWNQLMQLSIPASSLRADSPSLPENQKDVITKQSQLDTTTRDAIEIQPQEDEP